MMLIIDLLAILSLSAIANSIPLYKRTGNEVKVLDLSVDSAWGTGILATTGKIKFEAIAPGNIDNSKIKNEADCLEELNKEADVIVMDSKSLNNENNLNIMKCYARNRNNDKAPLYILHGNQNAKVNNEYFTKTFGFCPSLQENIMVTFDIDNGSLIVNQLSEDITNQIIETEQGSGSSNISLDDPEYIKQAQNENDPSVQEKSQESKKTAQRKEERFLTYLFETDFQKLKQKEIQKKTDDYPDGKILEILYSSERNIQIPAPTTGCGQSGVGLPGAQTNIERNFLYITLTMDELRGGDVKSIGQYVNVYHNGEIATNMVKRPGTNNHKSVGWYLGYVEAKHTYDTGIFTSVFHAPENVPRNADVKFDTSFSYTIATEIADPPSLSYEEKRTTGESISYRISDWDVRKTSTAANNHGWFHTNNKPYNGRDFATGFPPHNTPGYGCKMSKDGKIYNNCHPWASTLATDSGVFNQNVRYRTRPGTGHQTGTARFSYDVVSNYHAIESWGRCKKIIFWEECEWRACKHSRWSTNRQHFNVDLSRVKPTLLS